MPRRTATADPEFAEEDNVLRFDSAPEFLGGSDDDSVEDVGVKVKEAQERIVRLRQEQEELERQQKRFEELQQKQERFAKGKRELMEKLSRAGTQLERELYDAQKLVEELSITQETFASHLQTVQGLQPEKWHRGQLEEELESALTAIEDAEDEYAKGARRIASCRRGEAAPASSLDPDDPPEEMHSSSSAFSITADDSAAWMRRGFAFMLPFIGALLLGLVLVKLMF